MAESLQQTGVDAKHELGRHADAIADYDEAIRLKPDLATAYLNRGVAKQKQGQYEAAAADCNEAIRLKTGLGRSLQQPGCRETEARAVRSRRRRL